MKKTCYNFSVDKKIKKNGHFNEIYQKGRRYYGAGFSVLITRNDQPSFRLGISVQRKTGNAVRRNRIKRLIREVFRLNQFFLLNTSDIVVTVRSGFIFDTLSSVEAAIFDAVYDRQHQRSLLFTVDSPARLG